MLFPALRVCPPAGYESHFRVAEPLETHAANIARFQVTQTGTRPAGHELSGTNAALFAHHVDQHDSHAERITGRMPAHLLQHRGTVHRQRHR
jgi:hypothetical protein